MLVQKIKVLYQENKGDIFILWPIRAITMIAILSCVWLGFIYTKFPPQIPLYYSLPWGEEQLTHPSILFLLLGGGFFVFLVHVGIGLALKKNFSIVYAYTDGRGFLFVSLVGL